MPFSFVSCGWSCIKWWKLLNGAADHSAYDLYLIWFWCRLARPQSSDSSHRSRPSRLKHFGFYPSLLRYALQSVHFWLLLATKHNIFFRSITWHSAIYRICVSNCHWGWHWSIILLLEAWNWLLFVPDSTTLYSSYSISTVRTAHKNHSVHHPAHHPPII